MPSLGIEHINDETAVRNFRTIKPLGCSAVHIGGGEPLLRLEELADTSHFHIDLFGSFIPSLCSGLAMVEMTIPS